MVTKPELGGYVVCLRVEIGDAVNADVGFDLPGYAPPIAVSGAEPFLTAEGATAVVGGLIGATRTARAGGGGTVDTKVVTALTVVVDAGTIADDEISQMDFNTLRNGIALVDGDTIEVMYLAGPLNAAPA